VGDGIEEPRISQGAVISPIWRTFTYTSGSIYRCTAIAGERFSRSRCLPSLASRPIGAPGVAAEADAGLQQMLTQPDNPISKICYQAHLIIS
jgi:hypothetical protein